MKASEGFTHVIKEGTPYPMGISCQGRTVNVCVAGKPGENVSLLLYRPGADSPCWRLDFEEKDRLGGLYCGAVEGLPIEEYEYTFVAGEEEFCDPYARELRGREVFGEAAARVRGRYRADRYDWEGDVRPRIPYEDGILYTAHVRGMTMDPSAKVRRRGTFAGVQERIPYLKELGINMLELMPSYEFEELVPVRMSSMAYFMESENPRDHYRLNCWGYGKGSYFAPKRSYSSKDCPAEEFKDMVKALHRAGIELIMEFYFPRHTYPGLILDCLRYWVLEYHVDGFHLSGFDIPMSLVARDPLLADVKLMANDIREDEIYGEDEKPSVRNLAEYNDGSLVDMRRFLKGEEGQVGAFAYRARRNPGRFGVVNYIASHNGYTLADTVSYEEKHNEANGEDNRDGSDYNFSCNYGEEGRSRKKRIRDIRIRQMKNALLLVFLSQGTPCIAAGDECGNSQDGNNNAYCLDSPVFWVNYGGRSGAAMREFVRKLIAFRKEHPVFCQREELRGVDYHSCGCPDISYHGKNAWYPQMDGSSRQLGIMYGGDYADGGYFYVAYNMHPEEREFALPKLPGGLKWCRQIDTGVSENDGFCMEETPLSDQKRISLSGRTVAVLQGRKEKEPPEGVKE